MVEKRFRRAFALSLASDIFDSGPGLILDVAGLALPGVPMLGDLLDAATIIGTRRDMPEISEQKETFLSLLEFIPFGDILPSHTIPVVAAYAKKSGKHLGEALADLAEPPTVKELIEMIPKPSEILPEILPGEVGKTLERAVDEMKPPKLPRPPRPPSPEELLRIAKAPSERIRVEDSPAALDLLRRAKRKIEGGD